MNYHLINIMLRGDNHDKGNGSIITIGFIFILLLTVLLTLIILPYVLNLSLGLSTTNYEIALFEIEQTNENEVLITHKQGTDIDASNLIVEINNNESPVQFEGKVTQGSEILISNKSNGEEFDSGDRIDVIIIKDDSRSILRTKRIN